MIKNIIVISDLHAGCQLGLCPDVVSLDGGGKYYSSHAQKTVYSWWTEFWSSWVPLVTKKEPYIIVNNGDSIDGDHHGSKTPITTNFNDQINIAHGLIGEAVSLKKCAGYYHLRGTEAHGGKSGEYEEILAKKLGAIPDESGNYARWELWQKIGESLIHYTHHIGTTSSAAYESTAVYKELVEAFNEAGRWGDKPPDCVVRSHRHRQFETRIATKSGYGISLVTPGFQLKTPLVYRIAMGRSGTPQVGGYLIRLGDEDGLYTRFKVWKVDRPKVEVI